MLDIEDEEFIKKYIKESVIEKTIVDIAKLVEEDEKIIYELFRLLANSNAHTEIAGHMVEEVIAEDLEKISFWRTSQKDEVDIIIKGKGILLPIEVKYQNNITNSDAASVLKFCKKFGISNVFMVTKDLMDNRKMGDVEILFIPAWLFLLLNP